jgi:hypothetical protein
MIPFNAGQFFDVFRTYNETLWPVQVVLVALALVAVALVSVPQRWSGRGISIILAFLWAWIGLVYHLLFFAAINPMAPAFALLSVAGSVVFLWQGVYRDSLHFTWRFGPRLLAGIALIAFALIVYPLWSSYSGHPYPFMPTFGLPCPTTIFTMGMMAFAVRPYPRAPLIVPILWSLVGIQAAILLDVSQDLGLVIAAGIGAALLLPDRADRWLPWIALIAAATAVDLFVRFVLKFDLFLVLVTEGVTFSIAAILMFALIAMQRSPTGWQGNAQWMLGWAFALAALRAVIWAVGQPVYRANIAIGVLGLLVAATGWLFHHRRHSRREPK